MINKALVVTILFLCTSHLFAEHGLVKISDSKTDICGFLVQEGDKKYLYTTQSALFGMRLTGVGYKFTASSFSGSPVTVIGPLMVTTNGDVARVEITTEATDFLKIGTINDFGEKVTIFPTALKSESDKPGTATISGIGIDAYMIKAKLTMPLLGTPLLNQKGEVVGAASNWGGEINKKGWSFSFKVLKSNLYARLFSNMKWVPAGKVDFIQAGGVMKDTCQMLKEFMPLLNWWITNPYRQVPDTLSYPRQMKRFVIYNNERTPLLRRFVKEVKRSPIGREGKMEKIRDGCLHRAKLFAGFPTAQKRQLNLQWKTPFLIKIGKRYSREWDKVIEAIIAKKRSLEHKTPF